MSETQKKILDPEEVYKLRQEIQKEDNSQLWLMLFDTTLKHGLRAEEAVTLKKKHIDFEDNDLVIEGAKGGKNRTVAIPSGFLPHLEDLGRGKEEDDWLFPSPYSDSHYSKRSFQMRMRKWALNAGLYPEDVIEDNLTEKVPEVKRIRPHVLRHTFATRHLKNGTPIDKVSDMLGHGDVRVTSDEYMHLISDDHREYQEEIDL